MLGDFTFNTPTPVIQNDPYGDVRSICVNTHASPATDSAANGNIVSVDERDIANSIEGCLPSVPALEPAPEFSSRIYNPDRVSAESYDGYISFREAEMTRLSDYCESLPIEDIATIDEWRKEWFRD